jgi:hypothetical protein
LQAKAELRVMINESTTPTFITPSLEMDGTWTAFDNVSTNRGEFIQKFVPEIFLRPEVHKDTVESFRIIRKLLEHSYFEYKFYDIGALKTMITMEMALKIRYEEIKGEKWDQEKSLYLLIKWFKDRNYFEVYNPDYLKSLRAIRNLMAHPYEHTYSGASSSHLIENVVDLVNGLYEDPDLRKKRMDTTLDIISLIKGFNEEIKVIGKENTYLAYRAWPGFLNNKGNQELLHFYYKPWYKIAEPYFVDNQWGVSPTVRFDAIAFEIKQDHLLLVNKEGEELRIGAITNTKELDQFRKWRQEYEKFTQPTGDYLFTHTKITDTFLMHLRDFHKIL